MIDKEDIKYILCEILDNNSIFMMTENRKEAVISMATNEIYKFHSQDKDTRETLLRLNDLGITILVEIENDRGWAYRNDERIVRWTPEPGSSHVSSCLLCVPSTRITSPSMFNVICMVQM